MNRSLPQRSRRRRAGASRGAPAAAAQDGPSNPGAGQAEEAEQAHDERWMDFSLERQRELGRHDRRAAIALAIMQAVVIWRMSKEEVHPWQVIYCTLLMSTVLTVAVVAGTEEFIHKRRVMLAVLRVATAASPMVAMHTRLVMQEPQHVEGPWLSLLHALHRVLYGDHCTLMAFLGIAFHVGGALDIAVQIATLAIVLRRNEMICNAPYLTSLRSGLSKLHPFLGQTQGCMLYTALLQIICGWLAPQVFQVCNRAEGPARLLVLLPLMAGVVTLLSSFTAKLSS
ncbi:hypothetical protein D9Q98_005449 [Chlorella vulgaris]|uniref:Uncharacterized protein n=1 Tax=Chlorella vulgaris TaxID=3077 RepID=A0A9D4YW42_CHLVU|nr:hypothetical protein D9Q98_005449 [Chlorella vulgaris]